MVFKTIRKTDLRNCSYLSSIVDTKSTIRDIYDMKRRLKRNQIFKN